jgi:hypothetical protein
MAAASTPVSLDEYLNTAYEPDRDFVDGLGCSSKATGAFLPEIPSALTWLGK